MMKTLVCGAAALLTLLYPSALAAQVVPFKLVITWHQTGISVIDYPTAARCEAARKAVQAEIERRMRASLAAMPPGSQVIGAPLNYAFCIPD